MIGTLLVILITIFLPPVGVFMKAGCGMDLFINIVLTILGFLPGHVHAFYILYVYYKRRDEVAQGVIAAEPAPGIYSDKVQNGGHRKLPAGQPQVEQPGYVQPGYTGEPVPQQQQYGTTH